MSEIVNFHKKKFRSFGISLDSDVLDQIDDESKRLGFSRCRYFQYLWENRPKEGGVPELSKDEISLLKESVQTLKHQIDRLEKMGIVIEKRNFLKELFRGRK